MQENEWLDKEVTAIETEYKKLKNFKSCDNKIMLKILLMLSLFLIFNTMNLYSETDQSKVCNAEEYSWRCSACGKRNSSTKRDCFGKYVCPCGQRA